MKKLLSIILVILICFTTNCITIVSAATEWKTGNLVSYNSNCGYTDVYLTDYKTAKIKIYAYNKSGKQVTSSDSIYILMTDSSGNKITEFNTKNGSTLSLGKDHTQYRIYVKKSFTETYRSEILYKNKILTFWGLETVSNCTFDFKQSISYKSYTKSVTNKKTSQTTINNINTTQKNDLFHNYTYCISPKHAQNMVLDINGGNKSRNNGDNVLLWGLYNSYAKSRQFKFVPVGNGWYKIQNINSGLVLDVDCSNGNVIQYEYHGGNNQQWTLEIAEDGYYYIRCKETDTNGIACYLDVANNGTSDGTNVIVWHKNNSNNQKFKLIKVN